MPDVQNLLDEWLSQAVADPIRVDESPSGLNAEANANLWGFAFSSADLWERFVMLEERGRVWKDLVYARLAEEYALPHSPGSLLDGYVQGFARHAVPHEGVRETLAALRSSVRRSWLSGSSPCWMS